MINAAQTRNTAPLKTKVSFDSKSRQLRIEPATIPLVSAARNEVYWSCDIEKSQRIEITFAPNDTPFRYSQFHLRKGAGCLSGIVAKEKVREQPYECTVKLIGSDPKSPTNQEVIAVTKAYVSVK